MTKKAKKKERSESASSDNDAVYDDTEEDEDWVEEEQPAVAAAEVKEPEAGPPQSQPAYSDLSPNEAYNEWIGKGPEAEQHAEPKKGKKED